MKVHVYNIGQLVTMKGVVDKDGIGVTADDLTVVENAELVFENGMIRFCGPTDMIGGHKPDMFVDAMGGVVIPAFTDPHTHAVFAGSRHDEFEKRSEGATYLEIAEAGGGIVASTEAILEASVDDLARLGMIRVRRLNRYGVGAAEVKSGYGLSFDSELKILEAIQVLKEQSDTRIISTFLGAHAIPKEYKEDPDKYVDLVVNEMLPAVAEQDLADFCDVFAEKGFFSIEQARKILLAAKELGLGLKIHADEFESLGGAQLAAEVGATSADHLLAVDDEGITALADTKVTAVLLPGTSVFLGQGRFAPARKLIDEGVRVALATDLNPGSSYTENYSLIMSLACTNLKMTVAETLAAATYNAAKAVGLEGQQGALLPGRSASFAIFDVPHYACIPYHMGESDMTDLWIDGQHVIGDAGVAAEEVMKMTEETK